MIVSPVVSYVCTSKSKAKRDDKSLFGKHWTDEKHSNEAAEQKFEILHATAATKRRKLKEQLKIVRAKKEGKQILIHKVTKFESEKRIGHRRKQEEHSQPIGNTDFMAFFVIRISNRESAQEREKINQNSQ